MIHRLIAAVALLLTACCALPADAQHFRIRIGSAAGGPPAPGGMALQAGDGWTGTENSGNPGGVAPTENATQIGAFTHKAIARFAEPERTWIDSTDHTIALGAYLDTGIAYVDFILEGNTLRVTAPTYNARLGFWAYNVQPRAPPGKAGEAVLYARVVPNSGLERLVKLPITIDTNGLISATNLYVSSSGSNTVPTNNNCQNPAQRCQTLNYVFSKITSTTARYVINMAAGRYNEDLQNTSYSIDPRQVIVQPDSGLTADQVTIGRSDRRIFLGTWSPRIANVRFKNLTIDLTTLQAIAGAKGTGFLYGGRYVFDGVRFIDANGLHGRVQNVGGVDYRVGYFGSNNPDGQNQVFFVTNSYPYTYWAVVNSTGEGPLISGANLYVNTHFTDSADGLSWTFIPPAVFNTTLEQPEEFETSKSYEGVLKIAADDGAGGPSIVWDGVSRSTIYFSWYDAPETISIGSGNNKATFSAPPRLVQNHRIRIKDGCAAGTVFTVTQTNLFNNAVLPGLGTGGSISIDLSANAPCTVAGAHYEIAPLLVTNSIQPNFSVRIYTGAAAGGGTDAGDYPVNKAPPSTGIDASDVLNSRVTVLGDLRSAMPGDLAFVYLTFHADAFQQLGVESSPIPIENILTYNYRATGVSYQPLFQQTNNAARVHAGTIAVSAANDNWIVTSPGATEIRPDDFIQITTPANDNYRVYRRVKSANCVANSGTCTGTVWSPFPATASGLSYLAPSSMKDVALINTIISNTSNQPFHAQMQGGTINFNFVHSTMLMGDPATGVSQAKLLLRPANGTGFGFDGVFFKDSIIQSEQKDAGTTYPTSLTIDNIHWIQAPEDAVTNQSVGTVSGLTAANDWWPSSWGSNRTITTTPTGIDAVDINNKTRAAGDRVGALSKAP